MTKSQPGHSQTHPSPGSAIVQCDFDGTVTLEDASFIMLDAFARGDWRSINREYEAGRITVGKFNSDAFALVKATEDELLKSIEGKVQVRRGFPEFAAYCRGKGVRLVIVSNGLDFYIKRILGDLGLADTEVHAALTMFDGLDLRVAYIGPDNLPLDNAFKEAHVRRFHAQGYKVIYVGNGSSDLKPACESDLVFATGTLLKRCRRARLKCTPFNDFHDVTEELERVLA